MKIFKKMNIGSLEIADYLGTTPFLFLLFFFPLYIRRLHNLFPNSSYLLNCSQQLELSFLQQIPFAPCRYNSLFVAVVLSQLKTILKT